jgi:VWFA-related protein
MRINLFLILVLIFSAAAFVRAQDEEIRLDTNLVTVNISITDKKGKFVEGLKEENFEIFDNRTRQKIEHFSAGDAPVSYGIVYDMHPTTEERTKAVLESLRQFTKELGERDDFFLLAFNMRGSLKLDFIPSLEQLETHLPENREPNALYDAIFLAADRLRASRNLKRTLLIISDSADHQSRHNFNKISQKLKSFDAQVFAVVFDENSRFSYGEITSGVREPDLIFKDASALDRAALHGLTLKSGGTTHFPVSSNSFYLYSTRSHRRSTAIWPCAQDETLSQTMLDLRDILACRRGR